MTSVTKKTQIEPDHIDQVLLKNNVHFLVGDITESNVTDTIKWILYHNLEYTKGQKLLTLYINSTGGSLPDAFALISMMQKSNHNIRTIGLGSVISSAFLIFAAGDPGERYISKNTSCMIHQYSHELSGKYHDLSAAKKESELIHDRMVNVLTQFTSLDAETVKSTFLTASDVWLTAEEMLHYGVADYIF
jgi:ATP-dependent Clp protease protease subunit